MNENTMIKLQYNDLKEKVKACCLSGLGRQLVDELMPSPYKETVENRLRETEEAVYLLGGRNVPLHGIADIKSIVDSVDKGAVLNPVSLTSMSDFLRGCGRMRKFATEVEFEAPLLASYGRSIADMKDVEEEINSSIRNNKVDSDATKELKRIRRLMENAELKIREKLESFLKSASNKPYIQEFFVTERNGRFTIPIKAAYKSSVTGTVVDSSSSGSTVFVEPSSVSKYVTELSILKAEEYEEEYQILSFLTGIIRDSLPEIRMNIDVIGKYDMIFARAKYSIGINGMRPQINDYGYINIVGGVHPLLEGNCVDFDFAIGREYRTLIITGPNAGGKTVLIKAVGLMTTAVQSGLFIKAKEGTEMSVFNKIYVDIGDDQSLENALSTFSSHVANLAGILRETDKSTLLLFDEIGSGTEPNEGAALAISVLEEVYKKGAITLATTHYGEIQSYSQNHPDFENSAMLFNQETLEPLYKLLIGKSGKSNALWIARKMGISENVVQRASRYIESKSYDYSVIDDSKVRRQKFDGGRESTISHANFSKGDRVKVQGFDKPCLVYESADKQNQVTIYVEGEFKKVYVKLVKLDMAAADLYPQGYDLDSLFTSYSYRKLVRDLDRGSKKVLKRIKKDGGISLSEK